MGPFFIDTVCSAGLGFDRRPKQAQVELGVQTSLWVQTWNTQISTSTRWICKYWDQGQRIIPWSQHTAKAGECKQINKCKAMYFGQTEHNLHKNIQLFSPSNLQLQGANSWIQFKINSLWKLHYLTIRRDFVHKIDQSSKVSVSFIAVAKYQSISHQINLPVCGCENAVCGLNFGDIYWKNTAKTMSDSSLMFYVKAMHWVQHRHGTQMKGHESNKSLRLKLLCPHTVYYKCWKNQELTLFCTLDSFLILCWMVRRCLESTETLLLCAGAHFVLKVKQFTSSRNVLC